MSPLIAHHLLLAIGAIRMTFQPSATALISSKTQLSALTTAPPRRVGSSQSIYTHSAPFQSVTGGSAGLSSMGSFDLWAFAVHSSTLTRGHPSVGPTAQGGRPLEPSCAHGYHPDLPSTAPNLFALGSPAANLAAEGPAPPKRQVVYRVHNTPQLPG